MQHTPLYERDHGKLFQTSPVKTEYVNSQREVMAKTELLAGETFGIYPTFQNVSIGDLIGEDQGNLIDDHDIPKLIKLGHGEGCNYLLEAHDHDCSIRAMRVIMVGEILIKTAWVMRPVED
jgi:hypothetical protein